MRDDQVGVGVNRALDVVAHHAAVPGAGRHGAGVRVCQGDLAVRGIGQSLVHHLQPGDLLPDAAVAAAEVLHALGPCLAFLLTVDAHHLVDVAFDVGLQMRQAIGDLPLGEVPIAVVDGLELAAVDGNAVALQQADPAA